MSTAASMKLRFVTPEKTIFSERDIKEIVLPTESGEITVLPNHVALVSLISAGIVQIIAASPNGGKDEREYFSVAGGFIEVANNQVAILAENAETTDEVDPKRAEEAIAQAKKKLAEDKNIDHLKLELQLQKNVARLKLAKYSKRAFK